MPKIINKSQPLLKAAVYPISAYSRVVSLSIAATALLPPQFAYSMIVGTRVWLQGIKCWVAAKAPNTANYTTVSFRTGTGEPSDLASIRRWDEILPFVQYPALVTPWYFYDGDNNKSWEFSRLYVGESRRFGIIADRNVDEGDAIQVSFTIAEG